MPRRPLISTPPICSVPNSGNWPSMKHSAATTAISADWRCVVQCRPDRVDLPAHRFDQLGLVASADHELFAGRAEQPA
jgi:hypothetical protein